MIDSHREAWTVTASPTSPRRLRRLVPDLLPPDTALDLVFTAELLTHEMVANAVRHARLLPGAPITVVAECDEERLRVEVSDPGAGFDPLRFLMRLRKDRELQHGTVLIDALADSWGYRRGEGTFTVWFVIDLVPGRRPRRGRMPVPPVGL